MRKISVFWWKCCACKIGARDARTHRLRPVWHRITGFSFSFPFHFSVLHFRSNNPLASHLRSDRRAGKRKVVLGVNDQFAGASFTASATSCVLERNSLTVDSNESTRLTLRQVASF